MKSASPGQTYATPPCEGPGTGRAWFTALWVKLADLAPFTNEIVPMILGFPAS
jgi:hypothetical protein